MAQPNYRRDPKVIRKVMRLARQGKSCRAIAKAVGCSRTAVSNIAKDQGWTWGALNTEKATEARLAYSAEKRATQVLTLSDKFDVMAQRLTGPYVAQAFSIKDGTFHSTEMDCPDSKAANDLASACYRIVSTMKLLHNFEANADEQHGAVLEYLAKAKGEPL
jgi:hypothetical protein